MRLLLAGAIVGWVAACTSVVPAGIEPAAGAAAGEAPVKGPPLPVDDEAQAALWTEIDDYVSAYPVDRPIDKPGGIEDDLAKSFPKPDSVFPELMPKVIPQFKKDLYEKARLQLATSYQGIVLWPSDVLFGNSIAAGGLFLFEGKWDAINQGEDLQGSFVFSLAHIHTYGNAAEPLTTFVQTGSIVVNDALYFDVGGVVSNLFWEQWFEKDRFVIRAGQFQAVNFLDFFRYADARTSFGSPALSFPAGSIPFGPPGLGLMFKWWPKKDSGLYVVGSVNDINSELDEFDWSALFDTGDVFSGIEIGHNWKRQGDGGVELDHIHVLFFYGDVASTKAFAPNSKAGWGFKIAGEKQWGQWVGFASYAYNTSRGGGFGFTFYEHAINVGLAHNKPFGIRGEIAGAVTWVKALDEGFCGGLACNGEDQFGLEFYWKILIAPDFWLTPGLQVAIDPVNNPTQDVIWIPTIRFRLFF